MFIFRVDEQFVHFWFWHGLFVTRTKRPAYKLSLGPTRWVELSPGLKVGGLNLKAPSPGVGGGGALRKWFQQGAETQRGMTFK
jgi:hypothetical protein